MASFSSAQEGICERWKDRQMYSFDQITRKNQKKEKKKKTDEESLCIEKLTIAREKVQFLNRLWRQ